MIDNSLLNNGYFGLNKENRFILNTFLINMQELLENRKLFPQIINWAWLLQIKNLFITWFNKKNINTLF